MTPQTLKLIVNLIDIVMFVINASPDVVALYKKQRDLIERIINEGRNPNAAEMKEINEQIDALRAELFRTVNPALAPMAPAVEDTVEF